MAFFTDTFIVDANQASFSDKLSTLFTQFQAARAARSVYKTTLNELNDLSSRELADLGLNHSTLRSTAYEAAYGKK